MVHLLVLATSVLPLFTSKQINMKFQLWMEGYAATGERGTAQRLTIDGQDEFEGDTFMDAYIAYTHLNWPKELPSYVHLDDTVIWGCRIYDNEADARKTFG